ncbi:MAG: tetratricopeptide repeat protein [Methylobacterium sp.]|uniref:GT-D fold domain-containing protein n=1 Tax=Methylobacterium sp. TaxID=409 RepID=UPI00258C2C17|nr:tetratricopeptide repeat protein [Methylobacterium sp.]MBY0296172.1 tetratricopeptide repeat protein [Methylobacterium sp.]
MEGHLTDHNNDEALLRRAQSLAAAARRDDLRAHAAQMTAITDDLFLLVRLAIVLREAGLIEEADRTCLQILQRDPRYAFAHYELGVSLTAQGRHGEALASFARILTVLPEDQRAHIQVARLQMSIGRHQEAEATLERLRGFAPTHEDFPWLSDLNRYLARFPRDEMQAQAAAYEQSARYLQSDGIIERAVQALESGRGFSLVRLGDGEGAFLRISEEDEARFPHLYRRNRQDRARVWFDGEIDLDASGFTRTAAGLSDVIRNADVVGLPYESWIAHEYRLISPTSLSCLANVLRLMPALDTGQNFCTQLIHRSLHQNGQLAALLRGRARLGLIACHPGAPDLLARSFGIGEVVFHQIPGEKLNAALLGPAAAAGRHYPDRFTALMQELSRPLAGQLFLVAGGLLGKVYCDRIKRSGGVALDIGSLIDAWLGAPTRPGFFTPQDKLGPA